MQSTVPSSRTSALINSLDKGPHVLTVVASDAAGNTTTSEPVTVQVGFWPILTSFTATAGNGAATLAWSSPTVDPPITSYKIIVNPGGATYELGPDARSFVVTGLTNLTLYSIRLEVHNPVASSSEHKFVTPRDPDQWITLTAPAGSSSSGSPVRISWEAGPVVAARAAYYVIRVDGQDLRYVLPDVTSLDLPLQPGPHDLGVVAFDADGAEILPAATSQDFSVVGDPQVLFPDVGVDAPFYREIFWLSQTAVTNGRSDGTFGPSENVSREAIAAFLFRFAGGDVSGYQPPATPHFVDVPASHPFYREICWLWDSGITTGSSDGTFRGDEPISREAMAAFLFRLVGADVAGYPAPAVSYFDDVSVGQPFYREISWLAGSGITRGNGDGTYRPLSQVSREAMAAFLCRLSGADTWT